RRAVILPLSFEANSADRRCTRPLDPHVPEHLSHCCCRRITGGELRQGEPRLRCPSLIERRHVTDVLPRADPRRSTFNLFFSFLAGLLIFVGLYGFALWTRRRDPGLLPILIASL